MSLQKTKKWDESDDSFNISDKEAKAAVAQREKPSRATAKKPVKYVLDSDSDSD